MKVRKIGKSYKVVTNYRTPSVNHCSYKVFSNPSEDWEGSGRRNRLIYIELIVTNLLQITPKTGVFTKKVTNGRNYCKSLVSNRHVRCHIASKHILFFDVFSVWLAAQYG